MTALVELLLRPLADAFMQVGVFVALLAAPFGWAQWRHGDRLDTLLVRHARLAPLLAAAVTMPPGCGGAIIVMALYARGAVSFGAAIAALVATMGDASWVLLAAEPWLTVQLKALLLVTGAVTGYAVDALGLAPRRAVDREAVASVPAVSGGGGGATTVVRTAPTRLDTLVPTAFWVLLGVAALVAVPVTFQAQAPDELYLLLGCLGAVACVLVLLHGRHGRDRLADDTGAPPTSGHEVLRDAGREVAFVTAWVAGAYLAWALVSGLTGFDGTGLPVLGFAGVVAGALVGLVPGCAVQIVFAGLFLAGGVPLPTLVANTVSQDGDALLPLLALEKRSALLATVITTVPALVVGTGLLLLA
ncbi:putative manganese transporter [Nocardioides litoris]|uniref:putative manganese transporter n=1 Tax=Nocardioides litoris TaxID=1926648 RepID=UPI0011200A05|nr:putative manganese transporter [Nocardioides litoris]